MSHNVGRNCYLIYKILVDDISKHSINLHYPPKTKAESAWNAIHFMSSYDVDIEHEKEVTVKNDMREDCQCILYTWNDLTILSESYQDFFQKDSMDEEKDLQLQTNKTDNESTMFYCGHPDIEKTRGSIHLYRTCETFPLEEVDTKMLTILAIRATLGVDQLLRFMQNFLDDIQKLQILFQTGTPFYMSFILFFSAEKCREFFKELNGEPFSSLEPEHICQCAFVKEITTQCKQVKVEESSRHECNVLELPQCIICLELMEESVEGLLTTPCNHEFHLNCLKQYKSTDCPVCRYSIVPDAKTSSECLQCGATEDLWLCLICGFIGCGRYLNRHAVEHFETSNHTFAKQMDSERVWDYARDQYVHRLIQNKSDGKMVEYTVEAPTQLAPVDNSTVNDSAQVYGNDQNNYVNVTSDEKLDSIQIEYSYLISSELEKQRIYYEEKLKHMEIEAKRKEIEVENRLKSVVDEKCDLEKELNQVVKGKNSLEKKLTDLKTKLDISEKVRKSQFQDVDEMNKCLLENQNELKAKIAALEKEKKEVEETNRDLMFTIAAQQRMAELTEDERMEMSCGSLHLGGSSDSNNAKSSSHSNNTGAKPKRKQANKR